jgi:tRNA A-37 threonylcarbamoyl transferase component Bud32
MNAAAECPDEVELLALVNGDTPSEEHSRHLRECTACRRRIAQLETDLDELRHASMSLDPNEGQQVAVADPLVDTPQQIGRYKVLSVLDRGGQAWVFRVMHPTIHKEMVLKLARRAALGEHDDRLVAEARVLSDFDHPSIARVYDLDYCQEPPLEGHPFVVMELVRGRTLMQYVRDHPVDWREAARLVAQVARAVAEAHRRGITHRDISSRNILIDDIGRPRLIDFGLARLEGAWATTSEASGTVAGTPAFMAPEQAEARLEEIGPRTDVYALGAVLRWVLKERPVAAIPDSIQRVITKATAQKPANRYATADELAESLERLAVPVNRWKWLAGVSIAAFAAAIVLWTFLRPPRTPPVPPLSDIVHVSEREPLTSYLPLDSKRNVYLGLDVPKGLVPVAVWIDPRGTVELANPRLAPAAPVDRRFDRWECWRDSKSHLDPNDPSGTQFVIACARKTVMTDAQAGALVEDLRAFANERWLAALSRNELVRIGSTEFGVQGDMTRSVQSSTRSHNDEQVIQRLEELRQHLLEKGYSFFAGEAFAFEP